MKIGGVTEQLVFFIFLGPFVKKLVIRSSTSEGLLLNLDGLLPEAEKVEEKEETAEDDEEKPVQESVST